VKAGKTASRAPRTRGQNRPREIASILKGEDYLERRRRFERSDERGSSGAGGEAQAVAKLLQSTFQGAHELLHRLVVFGQDVAMVGANV
jgi:hypothetical protein